MIWVVYNILFAIGYSMMLPYFIFRMVRRGGYLKGFLERLCVFDAAAAARIRERPRIWIHAVSVGEILVALRFIDEFRVQEPGVAFVLTTTTSTGHSIAAARLNASDVIAYFPVDFPFVIRRALDLFRPRALVLVESELWPNLVRLTAGRGIPVILVNGRMSERSERGYKIVRVFFEKAINKVKLLCVQTPDDERRMVALGAKPSLVRVTGSAKYDLTDVDNSGLSRVEAALKTLGVTRDNLL
ncbi:MAG: glycosyltransferase N-terminal domain-containing protein, partial [bacterium]